MLYRDQQYVYDGNGVLVKRGNISADKPTKIWFVLWNIVQLLHQVQHVT
jgi:hypothetical protein